MNILHNWKNIRLIFAILSAISLTISFTVSGFGVLKAYTIQTNLIVMVWLFLSYYYNDLELKNDKMDRIKGPFRTAITMYITITFVIFVLLLERIYNPTGILIFTNVVNHYIIPLFFILDWYLHGRVYLDLKYAFYWLVYPVFYLFSVLINGAITKSYIYPFLNLNKQTIFEFISWIVILLSVFIIFGLIFVLISRKSKNRGY